MIETSAITPGVGTLAAVAVIGLGYVGLPLALLFLEKGFPVVGIDVDARKLRTLQAGRSYIPEIRDGAIEDALASGRFAATDGYDAIKSSDIIVICVPTPLDESRSPDLSFLEQAGTAIGARLRTGQLVILESSTYPGTTDGFLRPLLEASGLQAGKDFHLGYSPERIDPAGAKYALAQIPKVISGITEACRESVRRFYGQVFDHVVPVSSTEAAELTKLLENSYRLVNISFVNEFAMLCDAMELDVWEIIGAAGTKPFGYTAFYPGPGAGGHCIPVDPLYLQWRVRQAGRESRFIAAADEINRSMSRYVAERVESLLAPDLAIGQASILVYGAAYKKDLADARESGAVETIRLLRLAGAAVAYHDPYVPEIRLEGMTMKSVPLTDERLRQSDAVIIATDHSGMPIERIVEHASLVFDTRNATKGLHGKARIYRLGGGGRDFAT